MVLNSQLLQYIFAKKAVLLPLRSFIPKSSFYFSLTPNSSISTSSVVRNIKGKGKGASIQVTGARPGITVETDPEKLTKFCCGANIYKEGSDPVLKPDSEYPDWLWQLDCEPNKKSIDELDKDTYAYWRKVRVQHMRRMNALAKIKYV